MAKDFEHYFAQLRRIEEHREQKAEKEIRKLYKELLADTKQFVAETYYQLAEDGKLTYEILRSKGQDARFLAEVEQRLNDVSPKVSAEIKKAVEDMYEIAYSEMVKAVGKATNREELAEELKGLRVSPDMVKAVVDNPIAGLTLNDTLEKNRKNVIWDIKREIGIGLTMGDRYDTMAKRIAKSLDGDYKKAVVITRTEAGRARETGHLESAASINDALKNGVTNQRLVKTWKSMADGRVRDPHAEINGTTVGIDEHFTLSDGTKMKAPKVPVTTAPAGQVVNCRCYASYDLKEIATGGAIGGTMPDIKPMHIPETDKWGRLYNINSSYVADPDGRHSEFAERMLEFTGGGTDFPDITKAIIEGNGDYIRKVMKTEYGKKDVEFSKAVLDALEKAPTYEGTIYRLEMAGANPDLKDKIGSEFTLGLRSFTRDKNWLEQAADEMDFDEQIVYKLKGAKSLNLKPYSPFFQEQAESATAGRFKVIGITQERIGGKLTKVYEIEQVSKTAAVAKKLTKEDVKELLEPAMKGLRAEQKTQLANKMMAGRETERDVLLSNMDKFGFDDYKNPNAWYSHKTKKITINLAGEVDNKRGSYTTLFHEMGHWADNYFGTVKNNKWKSSQDTEFYNALRKDADNWVKSIIKEYEEEYEETLNPKDYKSLKDNFAFQITARDSITGAEYSAVSDLIRGLTKNTYELSGDYGHTLDYYSTENICTEAFAHFVEANISGGIRKETIYEMFPNAGKWYDKAIKELAEEMGKR